MCTLCFILNSRFSHYARETSHSIALACTESGVLTTPPIEVGPGFIHTTVLCGVSGVIT